MNLTKALGAVEAVSARKLLIVTYHFPPSAASGAFRLLGFARHLPAHGWDVSVVAPPSLPWEPVDAALLKQLTPATRVEHVPYPTSRIARRLAHMACWLPGAWKACKKVVEAQKPDVVLTSGPPHVVHYLGLGLKRRYGIPWITDFRDPWYAAGRLERGKGLEARRIVIQERLILNAADLVIANAPGAERTYRNEYPNIESKFVTLPNGYDRDAFDAIADVIRPHKAPLKVVHTGAIYLGRDPRPFLDALQSLSESDSEEGAEAGFFGPPPDLGFDFPEELRKRALSERVRIHGHVPYARCLQEMKRADVLLLMDTPGRSVGVPAKLYEYIGAGRPILALGETGGDLEWVLEQSGIPYRIAPINDSVKITAALLELAREDPRDLGQDRGREPFSRESIVGNLAAYLDELMNKRKSRQVYSYDIKTLDKNATTLLGGR